MTPCGQRQEPIYRYTQQGVQEVSTDGGATWSEAGSDPRVSGTIIPPPIWLILGSDNRCNGALSARDWVKFTTEFITEGEAITTIEEIIAIILGILTALLGPLTPVIATIIYGIAWLLLEVGQAALSVAHP